MRAWITIWCVLYSVKSHVTVTKPGVCHARKSCDDIEALPSTSFCSGHGNDKECLGTEKCCPSDCGIWICREPIPEPRSACREPPTSNCYQHTSYCNSDLHCAYGLICCDIACKADCSLPTYLDKIASRWTGKG
ncbi:whey acidic protein-like isoform X1 [Mytilus trossulus]|uniref:whey acidic protein-like isoform X1 n=1 Tax=Mytilus trossulus TaxID=6551 RepID=UPI00300723C0